MAPPLNRAFLDPAVASKLRDVESALQQKPGFAYFASSYRHLAEVLTWSREHGVPATLVDLEWVRSQCLAVAGSHNDADGFFSLILSRARSRAPAAAPLELGALEALGALDRLRGCTGIALESDEHSKACALLRELPLHLRLVSIELIAARRMGGVACPVCENALPPEPEQIIAHMWMHESGLWEEGINLVAYASKGKPFCVSGSMLGHYFDVHGCNRWLHRRAERREEGRLDQDIESLVDPFRTAHTSRGDDFEVDLCRLLETDGLLIGWEAQLGLESAPPQAARTRFVSEAAFNALPRDRRAGLGKLIDLKQKAKERCGCAACRGGSNAGAACDMRAAYRRISQEALQREGGVPTVLYQLMITPPPTLGSEHIALSCGYLDYVVLMPDEGAVRCTIIDAKATDRVKLGAKVQIAYYSLALREIASSQDVRFGRENLGLPPLRMSSVGGVWLFGQGAPVPFALTELERMVRDFMHGKLRGFLSAESHQEGFETQEWELRPGCLGCEYLKDCRSEAHRTRRVGPLLGLTRSRRLELERTIPQMVQGPPDDALGKLGEVAAAPQSDPRVRRVLSRHLRIQYDEQHAPIPLGSTGGAAYVSPRLAALSGGSPCLNGQTSLTLPATEDTAIHVVLLTDPLKRRLYAWALRAGATEFSGCIDTETVGDEQYSEQEVQFVLRLDETLSAVNGGTTAIYLAERHEHDALMRTLMAGAMRLGQEGAGGAAAHPSRCLRCLLLLIALPELVHLPDQPNLGAARPAGSAVPSVCVLLADEAKRMVSLPSAGPWRFDDQCGGLIPGWSEDPAPPTAELIYAAWRHRRTLGARAVLPMLLRRLDTGVMLLGVLRHMCASHSRSATALLPNTAPKLPRSTIGLEMQPELSKLAFVALLEAHTQHRTIVALRAAPLEERLARRRGKTALLRLDSVTGEVDGGGPVHAHFDALSELMEELTVGIGGKEWLLSPRSDPGSVDVMRWDDLSVRDRPPLGKKSVAQAELPASHVLLAEVQKLCVEEGTISLKVQCSASRDDGLADITHLTLTPEAEYVLQPRFVDFTTAKVVDRLRNDSRLATEHRDPLSVQLLRHTCRVGALPPTPPAPTVPDDVLAALPMTPSQQAIYNRVCSSVLTLTWGPPGSGKTHFLATAICRLMVASMRAQQPMRVLVTAVTHSALNHLLTKIARMLKASGLLEGGEDDAVPVLKLGHSSGPIEVGCVVRVKKERGENARRFRVLALEEDGEARVQRITSGGPGAVINLQVDSLVRVNDYVDRSYSCSLKELDWLQVVVGTTVFQMRRIHDSLIKGKRLSAEDTDGGYFDLLVVDEASQMQLLHMLLPLHLLRSRPLPGSPAGAGGGRLVVVGDTRQMGPILQNEYPADAQLCTGSPPPHWSLLRWLWARTGVNAPGLQTMLQENHRMTPNLAWFTERVLGYDGYRACGECGCSCHQAYPELKVPLLQMPCVAVRPLRGSSHVAEALRPAHTFVLIELEARPERADAVEDEAVLVAALVLCYLNGRGDGDEDSVFVVTPHHTQRIAVLRQLERLGVRADQVCVDTVEKMQGQERDLVVVCYGGLVDLEEAGELDFAYSRERLNTAITRAKKKCILVCSMEVLEPTLAACETAERQTGFELLRRISAHCPRVPDHGCVRLRQGPMSSPAALEDSQETILSHGSQRRTSQLSLAVASQPEDSDETDSDEGGGAAAGPPPRRVASSSLMPPQPAPVTRAPLATGTAAAGGSEAARIIDSQETQVDSMELLLVDAADNLIYACHAGAVDDEMTQLVGQGAHEEVPDAQMMRLEEAAAIMGSAVGTRRWEHEQQPATPPRRGHVSDPPSSVVPPCSPPRVSQRLQAAAASNLGLALTVRPEPKADAPKKKRVLPPSMMPGRKNTNSSAAKKHPS